MSDDRDDINTILDFYAAFQEAGRQVCTHLRDTYSNLHFNSLPPNSTREEITKAAQFAERASWAVIRDIQRQVAGYTLTKNARDIFVDEGRNPDGRAVLLNKLEQEGVDKMQGISGGDREQSIRQEMSNYGIIRPDENDVKRYDEYRTTIAATAMGIIQAMKAAI